MNVFNRLTLAARLSALFGIAVAVMFTVASVHLYRSSADHLRQRDDAVMMDCLDLLRYHIEQSPSLATLRSDSHKLLDVSLAQRGVSFAVWAANGQLLRASTPEAKSLRFDMPSQAQVPMAMTDVVTEGGKYRRVMMITVPLPDSGTQVRLVIAHNNDERVGTLRTYRKDLIRTAVAGTLLTSLLGYGIARRAMRPIKSIARASSEITASQLNERLRIEEAPAELEDMVRAFNQMLDRLEESFDRLARFSSDIAHDLRTPLTNLLGETQVALGKPRSTAEYEAVLASNIEELERLARLVEEMLFLARVEHPTTAIARTPVDLKAELEKVADFYSSVANERSLVIECHGHGYALGDRALLQRAIHNLFSNAVRYSSPGGSIQASISSSTDTGWVELSIANSGPGIPKEHLPRIFDRFYRADPARHKSQDGTGLGLAIVKSIAQLHGGEISVKSELDGITTFSLRLPAGSQALKT